MLHKNSHCLWQIVLALVCTYTVHAQKAVHFGGDFMLGSSLHLVNPKNSFADFKQQPRFFAGFNNNLGWIYYDFLYEWEAAERTVPLKYGITHH